MVDIVEGHTVTKHARERMVQMRIGNDVLRQILREPENHYEQNANKWGPGNWVYQRGMYGVIVKVVKGQKIILTVVYRSKKTWEHLKAVGEKR